MKRCLEIEFSLPYINFKTIGDYVILMCYMLKRLKVSKTEIKAFIRSFERITEEYKQSVNLNVSDIVIHPDLQSRLQILKSKISLAFFFALEYTICTNWGMHLRMHA